MVPLFDLLRNHYARHYATTTQPLRKESKTTTLLRTTTQLRSGLKALINKEKMPIYYATTQFL